jgi:hypothetical protein
MRGIRYVTDDDGRRVAVMLDLEQWGELWEDLHDVLLAEERRDEPAIPLEAFAAELTEDGVLKD